MVDVSPAVAQPPHLHRGSSSTNPEPSVVSSSTQLTPAQRAHTLALLAPSLHEVVLGAGWDFEPSNPSASASGSQSPTTPKSPDQRSGSPTAPPEVSSAAGAKELADALLIRSCQQGWNRAFELHQDWERPCLKGEDEVLIRNVAVGLNPVDYKSVLYNFGIANTPWVLGRDVAGIVHEVSGTSTGFKPGDRVWTCADSRDSRAGAYQQFSIAKAHTIGRIPERVTDEEAATVGTGLVTAAVILYWFFRLQRAEELAEGRVPRKVPEVEGLGSKRDNRWILVYGGGAVTGIYAIQLARLSGLRPIVIASPGNFEYLKSIGAEICLDRYKEPAELLDAIREQTAGQLAFAIDCVGSKTAVVCERALKEANGDWAGVGQLCCLAGDPKVKPGEQQETDADLAQRLVRDVKIHKISFSTTFYGDDEFSRALLADLDALFASGSLKPVQAEVLPDGLASVRRGLESLRDGTAPRAKKLVVRIADTPKADLTNLGVRAELSWNGVA
ncbi:hypothetical protein OC846_002506 [Tilletia horrida]|uniref:Enoyl reductase (ER) domain-containing protein n=1 Tax=Tilletia horrida TaxID=155126 RepID=A0AAN6GRV8_9BASI|nr:hypothetical protein OC845_003371 [Tilletia horrida]KAK0553457.1 hypothetical protein OC846_002506 [Tilletia horrida]KAK0568009.1 hypothetical protein OC861_002391 [Tilletia horrida]